MTAAHASRLVDEYLRRLEGELMDLPADKRQEIVDEIRGHIAEERTNIAGESDSDVLNLLDRLGDPADIASEARGSARVQSRPQTSASFGTLEVLALALMILAWPAGAVLLWVSKAWTTREKLLGTLVPPGGYPGVFLIMSTFQFFAPIERGPTWLEITVGSVLFTISLLLLVAPLGMCVYLATRLRRRA